MHNHDIVCKHTPLLSYRYEVVKKKTKFDDAISEMAERIGRNFCQHGRVQCGIVYCLSRNDCEKVAAELQVCANQATIRVHFPVKYLYYSRRMY